MTTLKTISEKLIAWRRYREAVRELSQLTDRELSDIGIRRGDIEDIVRRSVRGRLSGSPIKSAGSSAARSVRQRRLLRGRFFLSDRLTLTSAL